jgi:hypothetical protein
MQATLACMYVLDAGGSFVQEKLPMEKKTVSLSSDN